MEEQTVVRGVDRSVVLETHGWVADLILENESGYTIHDYEVEAKRP